MTKGSTDLYLDDFVVGNVFGPTVGHTFTQTEIVRFALQFDPQPFHTDVQAAVLSPYKGLIASGFHTVSTCFRLFIQQGILTASSLGSPGIDDLHWLRPVRPGDTLRTVVEVLEVRPSRSRRDRGILRAAYSALNQDDDVVLSFVVNHLLARRPEAVASAEEPTA